MKSIAFGLLFALLASTARAQVVVDVSKITCEQYVFSRVTNPRTIAVWLSGYFAGKRDKPTVDVQAFETTADAVDRFCRRDQNLKMPLMEAVEQVVYPGK